VRLMEDVSSMYGSPWLRLLRREVENLVKKTHGGAHLRDLKAKAELASINRELRQLKTRSAELEKRKVELVAVLRR
jgi:hypothetical protein